MEAQNKSKIDVVKFLLGQTVSILGSSIVGYCAIWYITLETKSGIITMLSIIATFLPQIIVSLFAGVWADRYNKKKLIMCSDAIIAIATLVLAIIFICGIRNIWIIFLIFAVRSFCSGIQMPAIGSFIPCITEKDKLMKVNGMYSMVQASTSVIAPILSGGLLALAKVGDVYKLEYIFLIDVATAIIGIGLLYTVKYKYEKKEIAETSSQAEELKESIVYLKGHKVIRKLLEYYAVLCFLFGPFAFLNVLFVVRTFGEEVWKLTANEISFGVGSIIRWNYYRDLGWIQKQNTYCFCSLHYNGIANYWYWMYKYVCYLSDSYRAYRICYAIFQCINYCVFPRECRAGVTRKSVWLFKYCY